MASPQRIRSVYEAAKLGLKGDNLAYAAGMQPSEYRQLKEFCPELEHAEGKARADAECALAGVMYEAAIEGDARAALDLLKHSHKWQAAQSIDISIDQRISITQALEEAKTRVIEFVQHEVLPPPVDTAVQLPPVQQRRLRQA